MDGALKIYNGSRHVTTPLSGTICQIGMQMLGLAMIDVCTKLEIFMFTHYEDMKGDEKCRNWSGCGGRGHPRSLAT